MSYRIVQGYVLVVLTGVVLLAATVLIVLQWGNAAQFSLYGKNISGANTALLMLFSAAGGIALWWCARWMFKGIRTIRRGRRDARSKDFSKRVEKIEKAGGEQAS
jgi:uncharacterized membrane-anchored protein